MAISISDLELLLAEKAEPLYKAHYALWAYWWPLWRSMYSERKILKKWRECELVKEGQFFLDYGCGTGCFTIAAAKVVGDNGRVYALDRFSRQLEIIEKLRRKEGLNNIEIILAEHSTRLPDESVDVVWMCDVLHEISKKRVVLQEVHRVLKRKGTLAIHDGMKREVLDYTVNLFSLSSVSGNLMTFVK